MNIDIEPGTYVVAVSGGVDSVTLLHALQSRPELTLVIAHFDHGIRDDSAADRQLVQKLAGQYQLPFIFDQGQLESDASEDTARQARYEFLHKVRSATGARSIITAHHQDDAIETAVLQLLRGTGRRGLSSLNSGLMFERPLLHIPKAHIIDYANSHNLQWREDITNTDRRYLRNYIRHEILPRLTTEQKQYLHRLIVGMRQVNSEIDALLDLMLHVQPSNTTLSRRYFASLPYDVAAEVMADWLRRHNVRDFDKKQLHKLVVAGKTFKTGQRTDINRRYILEVKKDILALVPRDR